MFSDRSGLVEQVANEVLSNKGSRGLAGMLPSYNEYHFFRFGVFIDPESRDDIVSDGISNIFDLKRTG